MALRRRDGKNLVFQLEVILRGTTPPIWRRIEVSETMTLAQLHDILQIVMGWTDSHLVWSRNYTDRPSWKII